MSKRTRSHVDDDIISVETLDPRIADLPEDPLSDDERKEFEKLDGLVCEHGAAFVAVGEALARIRDQKLYREKFGTFEEYARKRHELSRTRAHELLAAAKTLRRLETFANGEQKVPLPANERQVRPLLKLKPPKDKKDDPAAQDAAIEKRTEAWRTVVTRANGDKITARLVNKVVKEMLGDNGRPEKAPNGVFDPDIVSLEVFSSVSDTVRDWPDGQSLVPLEATLRQLLEIVEKKRAA